MNISEQQFSQFLETAETVCIAVIGALGPDSKGSYSVTHGGSHDLQFKFRFVMLNSVVTAPRFTFELGHRTLWSNYYGNVVWKPGTERFEGMERMADDCEDLVKRIQKAISRKQANIPTGSLELRSA